jgi:hypothetical protein
MKFKAPIEVESSLVDSSNSSGSAGQVLTSTGVGVDWIDPTLLPAESAEKVIQTVRFGEAVSKGDPLVITGYHGSTGPAIVERADATDATKMPAYGVALEDYANNATGLMIAVGDFNDFDTSSYSVGDTLYVAVGGGMTNVKPTGTALIQNMGIVSRSNANNGDVEIVAIGRTNDVPNLPTGRLFVGTATNTSLISDVVYVDDVNDRVGIGTASPGEKLEVDGNVQIGSTTDAKLYMVSTGGNGNNERFFIEGYADGGTYGGGFKLSTRNDSNIFNNAVTVDRNGNVGIGTTTPGAKLHVVSAAGGAGNTLPTNATAIFDQAGNNLISISGGSANEAGIFMPRGTSAYYSGVFRSDTSLLFRNNDAESMRITSSGNVGIGTTSAVNKLQIDASSVANIAGVSVSSSNNSTSTQIGYTANNVDGSTLFMGVNGYGYTGGLGSNYAGAVISTIEGAQPLVLGTDSTERMRITETGNVGIGTTSPAEKLDVAGKVQVTGASLTVLNASDPSVQVSDTDVNYKGAMRWLSSDNVLEFYTRYAGTYYTSNLVLDRGNVGIGTTSPIGNFNINGGTGDSNSENAIQSLTRTSSTGNVLAAKLVLTAPTTYRQNLVFRIKTTASSAESDAFYTDAMTIDYASNVGIGTTGPVSKLHVVGEGDTVTLQKSNNVPALAFLGSLTNKSVIEGGDNFNFYTGGGSRMYINSAGNVGIGTTDPTRRLHVRSTNEATGIFLERISNYGFVQYNEQVGSVETYHLGFVNNNTLSSDILVANELGNVGIGTTLPTDTLGYGKALDIQSSSGAALYLRDSDATSVYGIIAYDGNTTNRTTIGGIGASNYLRFVSEGNEAMRISSGNVGIGTTSPVSKLDVSGVTKTLGFMNTNNHIESMVYCSFPNGVADQNVDIRFGNISFWGYIEIEVTGSFSNQSTPGKLTKLYAVGTNPSTIYNNESRVSDALGDIKHNVSLGEFRYDGTPGSETFAVKLSHIVSTGNAYTIKVRVFTHESNGTNGAAGILNNLSVSPLYTEAKLSKNYVHYNDNVGIGTTDPEQKLHVEGTIQLGNTEHLAWAYDNGSYYNYITNFYDTSNGMTFRAGSWTSGNNIDFSFQTYYGGSWSTKLAIRGDGDVGIGTTSPTRALHVVGGDGGTGTHIAQFEGRSGVVGMYVRGDGNVGIGTTDPGAYKLNVSGTGYYSGQLTVDGFTNNHGISFRDGYAPTNVGIRAKAVGTANRDGLELLGYNGIDFTVNNGANIAMRIVGVTGSGMGNVGIGTTSPSAKLEVKSPSYSASNAVANFVNGNDPVRVVYDTVVIAQTDVPTLSIVETIDGSQASEQKLTFSVGDGKAVIASTSTATQGMYFNVNRDTSAPAYNTGNGITALKISNNGNVGIGTTGPGTKLHVSSSENANWTTTFQNTLNSDSHTVYTAYNNSSNGARYGVYISGAGTTSADYHFLVNNQFAVVGNGNVGIGTSSPSEALHINRDAASAEIRLQNNTISSYIRSGTDNLNFWVSNSEKMRITSSGDVGIGTTNPTSKLQITIPNYTSALGIDGPTGTTFNYIAFSSGGSYRGGVEPTTTGVTYASASDYRLKENIIKLQNSTERIKKLKPSNFNFLEDPSKTVDGFIAHEVQEVVPEAVTGKKDAVLPNGEPDYQGIDQSKLVPLLTAALQEAITKIEQLETRIQTLENKQL